MSGIVDQYTPGVKWDPILSYRTFGRSRSALEPIWRTKPETASRLRGRIERILDWAKVRQYRDGENPARWRGHLDKVFPARSKIRRVQHHPAAPIDSLPAIYGALDKAKGVAAQALQFTILTAARAGEAAGARWQEIDLQQAIWTIPGERMKAGRSHRVTLSREAVALPRYAGGRPRAR